jgi:hypothetical protein
VARKSPSIAILESVLEKNEKILGEIPVCGPRHFAFV